MSVLGCGKVLSRVDVVGQIGLGILGSKGKAPGIPGEAVFVSLSRCVSGRRQRGFKLGAKRLGGGRRWVRIWGTGRTTKVDCRATIRKGLAEPPAGFKRTEVMWGMGSRRFSGNSGAGVQFGTNVALLILFKGGVTWQSNSTLRSIHKTAERWGQKRI